MKCNDGDAAISKNTVRTAVVEEEDFFSFTLSQWWSLRDTRVYAVSPLEKVPNYRTSTKKFSKMRISLFIFILIIIILML